MKRGATPMWLNGRWALHDRIAAGATSTVWRARAASGQWAAVKIARGASQAATLAAEAERLVFLVGAGLPGILDAGFAVTGASGERRAFVALEWIEGEPLAPATLQPGDRVGVALAVARDVGQTLDELHRRGWAHGDVKPENILLVRGPTGHPSARLVDAGLCADADRLVPEGGTPHYLAPEVFSNSVAGDGRARDLWALGLVLAEVSSGRVSEVRIGTELPSGVPEEIAPLVAGLLVERPEARPQASWIRRWLGGAGLLTAGEGERERRQASARRSYLAVRRQELLRAAAKSYRVEVSGVAGQWLQEALAVLKSTVELRGGRVADSDQGLDELGALGQSRWLVHLVGAQASVWQMGQLSDAELYARLQPALRRSVPRSLTLDQLEAPGLARSSAPRQRDAHELLLALTRAPVDSDDLDQAERLVATGQAPQTLTLKLAAVLRLRGELERALWLLSRCGSDASHVEAAEVHRRAGNQAAARAELARASGTEDPLLVARSEALLARIELDGGAAPAALARVERAPVSAATLEVRALAELALGRREEAAKAIERALLLAADDEQRARLEAVVGYAAHDRGDHVRALSAYRRAAEFASRVGAVLEEATYLTGVAASAPDSGELSEALQAAQRAELLFEALGRTREAARAALSRSVVWGQLGALVEARQAAADALDRARQAGDTLCRGYVHLVLSDLAPLASEDSLEHARRASALLEGASQDDRLRAMARRWRAGEELPIAQWDALAASGKADWEARADWWRGRAERALSESAQPADEAVLSALAVLAVEPGSPAIRGATVTMGARLAALRGQGELARRLTTTAAEDARRLLAHLSEQHRRAVQAGGWAAELQTDASQQWTTAQLADVENLMRALGRRDRLGPLLDQILDALVLWTGVERGLLLIRAPGGRLVPRSGRNLAHRDLEGDQLELSRSLAERALNERQPIVAVDATRELADMHASVHALRLRSVLAVPLIARGEAVGVVYLDDRVRRGAFGERELSWVRLVATVAAVAIADARDQLLLRRAARRAQRAEARIAEHLARREAALEHAERELALTRRERSTRFAYGAIVGESTSLGQLLQLVDRVTVSEVPVLIAGESGSGKELVARAIHENGARSDRAFVSENCGAIPETLLESALFGHVKGAFTGAQRPRAGLFEVADQGTLFLDEIGETSLNMQKRLLRVLEEGEFRPVGSERVRRVDVRVIAATNRDLRQLVREGRFREDLLYRLDVITLKVPPLRERVGDIPLLVRHFLDRYRGERPIDLSGQAQSILERYPWPGNVRQLENEVRRALVLADDVIGVEHLSPELRADAPTAVATGSPKLRERVDALERELVLDALGCTGGNQTRAAELLGLSRFGLQKMIKRLEIVAPRSGRTRREPLSNAG